MNDNLLDALTIASFGIAIQNLKENEKQTASLKDHLKEQDGVLAEQTEKYLIRILKNQEKIIKLLEGR